MNYMQKNIAGYDFIRLIRQNGVLILAFFLWLFLYQDALITSVRIWYVSEIFTHGFFIIPGSLYFIWRERGLLAKHTPKANYWVLLLLIPMLLIGLFGRVGGIQVFTHISAFTVLPLAIWLCLGNAMSRIIWFPLCFMLFSIPIGEELVPFLQKITAEMAVIMLGWTPIPIFNTGLYIEIPQGKFVVAEACSGIRFFVGSLVFGAVYSHITYKSIYRKISFMSLSVVVPVVANALRVMGIVMVGYYSDMEYATGADHLVYGWVFFSIVLFLLVLLGELFKETVVQNELSESINPLIFFKVISPSSKALSVLALSFLVVIIWQESSMASRIGGDKLNFTSVDELISVDRIRPSWEPVFSGESDSILGALPLVSDEDYSDETMIDFALVWYAENKDGKELVASSNYMYDKEKWSILKKKSISVLGGKPDAQLLDIVSSVGNKQKILYWYQLSDQQLGSQVKTKLFQSLDIMLGGAGAGALIAFSLPNDNEDGSKVEAVLLSAARKFSPKLIEKIPF